MYERTIKLQDDELPIAVNQRTGETRPIKSSVNNIPEGKEIFEPKGEFRKDYTSSWLFLDKNLTDLEMRVVQRLCFMAKMNTNSLQPLSDDLAMTEIAEILGIHRHKAKQLVKKLYELGVYARFEVAKEDVPYTKYWILNPYLSFSGKLIDSDIAQLFVGTKIEKAFRANLHKEL